MSGELPHYQKGIEMSNPKGAIPKLIVFIFGLILGLWFFIPSEVDLSVMILDALAGAIRPFGIEQANRIVDMSIIFFRIFGVVLIVGDALGIYRIYLQLRREQYF